jgi:hypothetical protein
VHYCLIENSYKSKFEVFIHKTPCMFIHGNFAYIIMSYYVA